VSPAGAAGSTGPSSTAQWWAALRATAFVGTARRPVPEPLVLAGTRPAGPGPVPDEATGAPTDVAADRVHHAAAAELLDAAAIVASARRAGRRPATGAEPPEAAPADPVPPAPLAAGQLLALLVQGNVDVHPVDSLLADWFDACARAGRRLPTRAVVGVLDRATVSRHLRPAVAAVAGERARWLAGINPAWSWLVGEATALAPDPVDVEGWALLTDAQRLIVVRARRRDDPDGALALVRSTWSNDPASVRAAHLTVLADGRSAGDEELLEAALDDRARSVREAALRVLDGRGESARAERIAARLAPLVSVAGTRRHRRLAVEWPDGLEPDEAAVRDGLGAPPAGRSARGWWLRRLAAGAPLPLWTDLAGDDPAGVVELVDDEDVLAGLADAVIARRDGSWAGPLFRRTRLPTLLAAVPPDGREALVAERLAQPISAPELGAVLDHLDPAWSASFSATLVKVLRAQKHAAPFIDGIGGGLGSHLHRDTMPTIERWLRDTDEQPRLARQLRMTLQFESFRRSITEAFR